MDRSFYAWIRSVDNGPSCRYLSTSGLLLWSLALLFLIARPALAFLEQFWLRRASRSLAFPLSDD